ncbi:hypothetical protein HY214_02615 [Candidatus Roizmanbacteria bacterium]|nr:hypothetical protein [Candidatus Roizmanbacteria bacterium]
MDKKDIIHQEADELLKKIISTYELSVDEDGGAFHVVIKADEEAPTVIGRHGETIRALQKILEVILYKKFAEPVDILVNVNDYREKQKERLEGIAESIAQRVKTDHHEAPLRSFSAYERKVIHEFIATHHPDLVSYSEGEGKERYLIIKPKAE